MLRVLIRPVVVMLLLATLATAQAQSSPGEGALRAEVSEALWPGDIVRAADRFLQAYPSSPDAVAVADERERALETWRVVRLPDLRLYRTAFDPAGAPAPLRADLRLAALGDRSAAVRLAEASRAAQAPERWIGWLQYAATLGDDEASYALALHYRRSGQPLLASRWEARALALGYRPAPALDNVRK